MRRRLLSISSFKEVITMKEFTYVITDTEGIHARPAGELVKKAKEYASSITIIKEEKRRMRRNCSD